MQEQRTAQGKIVEEKQIIAGLLNLSDLEQINLNDSGWDSRVYLINSGQFVFKFPRAENVQEAYRQEIAGYQLASQISSPILVPQVRWIAPDFSYFGYEGIVGEPLKNHFQDLLPERKEAIGRDLGTFLKALHDSKLESAPTMTLEQEIDEFKEKYLLGLPVMRQHFTTAEQKRLHTLIFDEFPGKLLALKMAPGLCHGDLGYGNLILSEKSQIGIIDFGDLGYYDRSKDLAGLTGPGVLDAVLSRYGEAGSLRRKVAMRREIEPILNLPYFMGKDDGEGILMTIKKIRTTFFE